MINTKVIVISATIKILNKLILKDQKVIMIKVIELLIRM